MRPVFVAEFTTNHMGNLNVLLRMVESAAAAGCSLIKMQKKDIETFYTPDKLDSPYLSPYGKTYRDYRSIFEFGQEDFDRLDEKARQVGVRWFSTVQDLASLKFMLRYDLPMYKVASCNARNRAFLEEIARSVPTDKCLVISVAGSTLPEIEQSLNLFHNHSIYLLHCVAEYPCPPESLRLGNILELKRRFEGEQVTVGYSGHEVGISATLAAIDFGAGLVERHFCLSRHSFVHHIECSLEPEEFGELVALVDSGLGLPPFYAGLPPEAFRSEFGMSAVERSFLVEQRYGQAYIKERSGFVE